MRHQHNERDHFILDPNVATTWGYECVITTIKKAHCNSTPSRSRRPNTIGQRINTLASHSIVLHTLYLLLDTYSHKFRDRAKRDHFTFKQCCRSLTRESSVRVRKPKLITPRETCTSKLPPCFCNLTVSPVNCENQASKLKRINIALLLKR